MAEPKYKPGDKFIVEITEGPERYGPDDCLYFDMQGHTFTESFLDSLKRYDEAAIVRQAIQRRIDELTEMVIAFEKERDALCDAIREGDKP